MKTYVIGLRAAASMSLLMLATACGEDNDAGKAREECEALATTLCDRYLSCSEAAGAEVTDADFNDCFDAFTEGAQCAKASSVEDSYAQCLDDLMSASCEATLQTVQGSELPPTCQGVIRI